MICWVWFIPTDHQAGYLLRWLTWELKIWWIRAIMKLVQFLLSEHILCKESIVGLKRFDFEIFTYLYVLKSPEYIYAIFEVMYVCVCMCVCLCAYVCMWINTIASKRCIRLSSNLLHMLQVAVGRTLLILVNIGYIVFFTGVQEFMIMHEFLRTFMIIKIKTVCRYSVHGLLVLSKLW